MTASRLPSSSQAVTLARYPTGAPQLDDFAVVDVSVPELESGQVLVRND